MSGQRQESSGQGFQSSQNMGTALLANLFGQGAQFSPEGVTFANGGRGRNAGASTNFFANPVFGRDSLSSLGNLTNPTPRNAMQNSAEMFGNLGLQQFPATYNLMQQLVPSNVTEAMNTGFRTDMSPIIAEEQRRFGQETVPDLAERFAGLAGGTGFGSDLGYSMLNAGRDMGIQLGAGQAQLDEAAAGRRMEAMNTGPAALTALQNLPTATGLDMLGFGQQAQADVYQSRPEVQLMNSLGTLFGLSPSTMGSSNRNQSKSAGGGYGG